MRYLVNGARILVGALFIVSGLIKANDPKGFAYKMDEYFEVFSHAASVEQDTLQFAQTIGENNYNKEIGLAPNSKEKTVSVRLVMDDHGRATFEEYKLAKANPEGINVDSIGYIYVEAQLQTTVDGSILKDSLVDFNVANPEPINMAVKITNGDNIMMDEKVSISPAASPDWAGSVDVQDLAKPESSLSEFFDSLPEYGLFLSILVVVVEIILGIAILLGAMTRLTVWTLLLLIIYFTFLTFYAAYTETIKDCGCFGDALTLTPWESFAKDVVLLVLVVILFIGQKHIKLNTREDDVIILPAAIVIIALASLLIFDWGFPIIFSIVALGVPLVIKDYLKIPAKQLIMAAAAILISTGFTMYSATHLPLKDYRPFKIGVNIMEAKSFPEGKKPPEYAVMYTLKDKTTGEEMEVRSDKYLLDEKYWEMDVIKTGKEKILVKEGYEPPINNFLIDRITDYGTEEYHDSLLAQPYVVLFLSKDLEKIGRGRSKANSRIGRKAERSR